MNYLRCLSPEGELLPKVQRAATFWTRLKGLLGRTALAADEGLLIEPCNSVHTLGMRFAIGVIFLSANNQVLHLIEDMPPGRLSPMVKGSKRVLELHPDTLGASQIKVGDQLSFTPHSDVAPGR